MCFNRPITLFSEGSVTICALCANLALVDELYGPPVGAETPRSLGVLTARLDVLLPGIRLKERLKVLGARSHQQIADVLALDGQWRLPWHRTTI